MKDLLSLEQLIAQRTRRECALKQMEIWGDTPPDMIDQARKNLAITNRRIERLRAAADK